ncbi:MAG: DPP IV N-terminal domain-containing protein [Ilumatobacteraceae bacterium]
MTDTFPRQYARTQRLTLGEPRNVVVSPDGLRVVFARSRAGDDSVNCLWALDVGTGEERLVADPLALLGVVDDEALPAEERARRERMREGASGITAFATDEAVTVTAFALAGRLFVAGLVSATSRELPVDGPVFDPRPDPPAQRVAYVSGRSLRIGELDGTSWELAGEEREEVSWGSAEFVAAEEMGRFRGYWWSPDGQAIAACRVDVSPVTTWYISDPANPEAPPNAVRYPAAGTDNADVTLHVLVLDGSSTEVTWDREAFPYLTDVMWASPSRLLLAVMSRDQRTLQVLEADPAVGATSVVFTDQDDAWVELVPGTPGMLGDGRLVMAADRGGARRLMVGDTPVTPDHLQVRAVVATVGDGVVFTANPVDDATILDVWRWTAGNSGDDDGLVRLTDGDGIHGASVGGDTVVLRRATLTESGARTTVVGGPVIVSHAETPLLTPNVTLLRPTDRELATALLLPHDHDGSPLPVLLDPYGGPHAQRAIAAHNAHLTSQWFADQGFAVVVVDGRGTPGRGTEWERAVHLDLATAVLDDQVDALQALAADHPLDLSPRRRPRLELRRLPGRAGGAAPSRRVPRRRRRRAGHRVAAVRHLLHGALPR